MLQNKIEASIIQSLPQEPTKGQLAAAKLFSDFFISGKEREIFLLKGYAGTGKTTFISSVIHTLSLFKISPVLLAPTGRAAKVLSAYSNRNAFTIHKKIYRQKSGSDGLGEFIQDRNLHKNTVFIVDEAGMIGNSPNSIFGSESLLANLLSYVYSGTGCKLLLCGDTAQLPPVGYANSPALDPETLQTMGYLVREAFLSDVVRQALSSDILLNATQLRTLIGSGKPAIPKITPNKEVSCVNGSDLIEKITESYEKKGVNETIIVNRSNKRANQYNMGIRNQILWREEELARDDHIMIVKNNYYWIPENFGTSFIANGDTGKITRVHKRQQMHGFEFADVSIEFTDYQNTEIDTKVILDTLSVETPNLTMEQNKQLFFHVMEDYAEEKTKKARYKKVKEDPFFNALQIKFAYAVTCHKSQGGQWKDVYIDLGYFTEEMIDEAFLRWLYTAFTRATEKVYLINFPAFFFK
jgi:exodeoxyribonuclease V